MKDNMLRQKRRRRGILLTQAGWQKLQQAQVLSNEFGERHTLEYLSKQTLLDSRTICRILEREVAVDKRSLIIFFNAFNLELSQQDYTAPLPSSHSSSSVEFPSLPFPSSKSLMDEELLQIRRQLIESCHCFIQFLNLDCSHSITLTVKFAPKTPPQLHLNL